MTTMEHTANPTVRFQGIFRYKESESARIKAEGLKERGFLASGDSLVGEKMDEAQEDSWLQNGLHAVTSSMQTTPMDGQDVLNGIVLTEQDNGDFWCTQYPDQFKPEEFEEADRLNKASKQASKDAIPGRNFLENLTVGGWAVRKLFGNKRLKNAQAADRAAHDAAMTGVRTSFSLFDRMSDIKGNDPEFHAKLSAYVDSHPTAADGTPRVDEWVK